MAKVANAIILAELTTFLADNDFFTVYPSHATLERYLKNAVSDGDKIRAILRDEYVQRELFADWRSAKEMIAHDPLAYYLKHRPSR